MDPWLTQNKKTCPVCKQRVTRKNPEQSESESEDDSGGRGEEEGSDGEGDSERTPLLRASNPGSPSTSPGAYSSTTTTTAQCLASPAHFQSPILGYEDYHSAEEDSDSDSTDEDDERHHSEDDTAQLISRGGVIWRRENWTAAVFFFYPNKDLFMFWGVLLSHCTLK